MNKIRINQLGYAPGLPKRAALLDQTSARLLDEAGQELRRFDGLRPWFDPASGDRVALIDLGHLAPGEYSLNAGGESRRIRVERRPYSALTGALVKGLYYQRCGCALEAAHAGPYAHAACHTAPAKLYENPEVELDASGGWHDAGDYGRYVSPAAVTVGHLLYAYRWFPKAFQDALNIPESGNGLPDVLNECRFELEWLLKMQREDGALYHKLTKKRFAPFIMPEEDKAQEYLLPPTHTATAGYAACAALASRAYRPFDAAFSARLLESAVRAWAWLEQNPRFVPYENPEDVKTGAYGDTNCLDEAFWAASELYASTGEARYLDALTALCPRVELSKFGWREVGGLGALCCLFELDGRLDKAFADSLQGRFLLAADAALEAARLSGYGTALSPDGYVWGSSLPILCNGMLLIAAWKRSGKTPYLDAALNQLDYLLGLNALDLSLVTGYGERPFRFPHHRPSAADGVEDPVPGLVSGGPNARNNYPSTRERLPKGTYPAKSYLDETPSADTNEIAIYWNSPAVFVAACFDQLTRENG